MPNAHMLKYRLLTVRLDIASLRLPYIRILEILLLLRNLKNADLRRYFVGLRICLLPEDNLFVFYKRGPPVYYS